MCLAQGPQRSDAGEARPAAPPVSSQALYHWATALPVIEGDDFTKYALSATISHITNTIMVTIKMHYTSDIRFIVNMVFWYQRQITRKIAQVCARDMCLYLKGNKYGFIIQWFNRVFTSLFIVKNMITAQNPVLIDCPYHDPNHWLFRKRKKKTGFRTLQLCHNANRTNQIWITI